MLVQPVLIAMTAYLQQAEVPVSPCLFAFVPGNEPAHPEYRPARSALPRERVRCVPGMFSSLEVQVLYPT